MKMIISVAMDTIGQISPGKAVSSSNTISNSKDRLILRVCVGGLRRINDKIFETNASRRIYFELKTGSFSRTTKTIVISNSKPISKSSPFVKSPSASSTGDFANTWNETFNLASSKRDCAPLVISAFEDRSRRGSIASLAVMSKVGLLVYANYVSNT